MTPSVLPVATIGVDPMGLAAPARLQARGLAALMLEAGAQIGRAFGAWRHGPRGTWADEPAA